MEDTRTLAGVAGGRFASNIKRERERRGLSQRQVAEALEGLGHTALSRQQAIAKVENGDRAVLIDEALAFARVLGTSIDKLARPEKLGAEAGELLDAAQELRRARREAAAWAARERDARHRLEKAVTDAEDRHAAELADEIWIGRSALDGDPLITGGGRDAAPEEG